MIAAVALLRLRPLASDITCRINVTWPAKGLIEHTYRPTSIQLKRQFLAGNMAGYESGDIFGESEGEGEVFAKDTASESDEDMTTLLSRSQLRRQRAKRSASGIQKTPFRGPKAMSKVRRNAELMCGPSMPSSSDIDVPAILGELSHALKAVVKRLEKQESQLKSIEQNMSTSGSSSGSSEPRRPTVSSVVRVSPFN